MYGIDITILEDAFIPTNFIISKIVFPKLHKLFIENDGCLAMTFPCYSFARNGKLGNIIRILCEDAARLEALNLQQLFAGAADYVSVADSIKPWEDFILFKRIRTQNSVGSTMRRYQRRHPGESIDEKQIVAAVNRNRREKGKHAYIMVKSSSTKQEYSLFLAPAEAKCTSGFTSYGLVKEG